MSKENLPNKEPGFVRYIMAANATGGGSINAFLISMIIFFPLGYYTHYKKTDERNIQVNHQSVVNKALDEASLSKSKKDKDNIRDSLVYLGYSDKDIQELLGGKQSRLDRLKNKFIKIVKGDTIYVPNKNCKDDYLGEKASKQINDIILRGHRGRYDNPD